MPVIFLPGITARLGKDQKTTSKRKIKTNRDNAQLSTGPKSAEGKKASSRSALKHGLLAKDVVITTRAGREDQGEYDEVLAGLRDYYEPVGSAEDLLVQELVKSNWWSARADRCARGDVACAEERHWEAPDESELTQEDLNSPLTEFGVERP